MIQCLQSIYDSNVNQLELKIYVVDNNSIDQSVKAIRKKFPNVNTIQNTTNVGFGRANNQALEMINSDYTLLLNPDTILNPDTLNICTKFMQSNDEYAACGVKMVDGIGQYLPESKRSLPTAKSAFFKMSKLGDLFSKSTYFNSYYTKDLSGDISEDVEVLCGAFMFCRTSILKKLGGFDEAFFMYGEDIDLSKRILEEGHKIKYLSSTSIIHFKGESSKKASFNYIKSFYNSMIIYVDKHYKGSGARFTKFFLKIAIYISAFSRSVREIIKATTSPLLDGLILLLGLQVIKYLWSTFYFNNPSHFDNIFSITSAGYVIIWVFNLWFWGWYDGKRKLKSLFIGFLTGTLILLTIYALLPFELRSSRAILLMGSLLVLVVPILNKYSIGKIKRYILGLYQEDNILIIGSEESANHIENNLLQQKKVSLRLDPFSNDKNKPGISNLVELVSAYQISTIIFASKDVESSFLMNIMSKIGDSVRYQIADSSGQQIVGSSSSTSQGQIYDTFSEYNLSQAVYQRLKRTLDFNVAIFSIVLFPFIFFSSLEKVLGNKRMKLLLGRVTLISYDYSIDNNMLPTIKPGLIKLNNYIAPKAFPRFRGGNLNEWYAMHYSPYLDLEILKNKIFSNG